MRKLVTTEGFTCTWFRLCRHRSCASSDWQPIFCCNGPGWEITFNPLSAVVSSALCHLSAPCLKKAPRPAMAACLMTYPIDCNVPNNKSKTLLNHVVNAIRKKKQKKNILLFFFSIHLLTKSPVDSRTVTIKTTPRPIKKHAHVRVNLR